ncbi:hypothetical protein H920_16824 [Fukomys damarensis]|uniref:Uncharacterized protein n=1 Tax=Fukomys damarensis TaxID=885580 RepID=A0A091CTJ1_FUKDA|nr:hypothetical protein H920_16824 [Fukomys damarensis]
MSTLSPVLCFGGAARDMGAVSMLADRAPVSGLDSVAWSRQLWPLQEGLLYGPRGNSPHSFVCTECTAERVHTKENVWKPEVEFLAVFTNDGHLHASRKISRETSLKMSVTPVKSLAAARTQSLGGFDPGTRISTRGSCRRLCAASGRGRLMVSFKASEGRDARVTGRYSAACESRDETGSFSRGFNIARF